MGVSARGIGSTATKTWCRALVMAVMVAVVTASPGLAVPLGELTQVTPKPCGTGSSNPTFYSSNHRMVVTSSGRQLALYDPHGSGQQLVWRDPGGSWNKNTTGAVTDGFFNPADSPNDRTASIAIAQVGGLEYAYVVYAGYTASMPAAVKFRRLGNLGSPQGPNVGPEQTLETEDGGNFRVDIAVESTPTGSRAAVTYLRRPTLSSTTYDLVVGYLSDLGSDNPVLVDRQVLNTSGNSNVTATLVPSAGGMRVVARTDEIRMYTHASGTSWSKSSAAAKSAGKARPSAVELSDGSILATAETVVSDHVVKIFRFSADGSSVSTQVTTPIGYIDPTITTNGVKAWVVMVRRSDGALVSREFDGNTWGNDIVELSAADGGGDYRWPNTVRNTDANLRILLDGPRCPSSGKQNQVLAYQRPAL